MPTRSPEVANSAKCSGKQLMKHIWRWIPVILVVAVIFVLSDIPNLHLYDDKALSPVWKDIIKRYTFRIGTKGFFSYTISPHPEFILRKLGHMGVYAALGVAAFLATRRARIAALLSIIYAIADETHQAFVIGRSCRFWDMALDSVSAIIAIWFLKRFLQKRAETKRHRVTR